MKRTKKECHKCTLKGDRTLYTLPPLAPNATVYQKFGRWFRKQCLLNLTSKRAQVLFSNQSSRKAELRRHAKSPYFYVIHPYSRVTFLVEFIFFIIWIVDLILYPLEQSIYFEWHMEYSILNIVLDIIRLILIGFFFIQGYVDFKRHVVVIEPRLIILHYLKTNFFFDFIASFGEHIVYLVAKVCGADEVYFSRHTVVFIIVFVAHLTRLSYLIRTSKSIFAFIGMGDSLIFVVSHICQAFLFLHFLTCFVYGTTMKFYSSSSRAHMIGNLSWMHFADDDRVTKGTAVVYNKVALVVTCYFLGAQHGMYSVTLPGEQFVFFILAFSGRLYTLFVVADLLRFFGLVKVSESKYEQYMVQLEEFLRSKNVPPKMKAKLIRFYEYKFQKEFFDEGEIFDMLSDHLKTELFLFGARKLIDKISIFRKLPRAILAAFISQMRAETFLPNDVIIKAGDLICDISFVSSGTVAVLHDLNELTHLVDGEVMGLVSMFKHQQKIHHFSHVAVEITEIYSIDRESFMKFLDVNPEVSSYFQSKADHVAWRYEAFERKNVFLDGDGVLENLRRGRLLEKPRFRPAVMEP